jgi:uncharacterized membrane protein YciS (DUF1049 family)
VTDYQPRPASYYYHAADPQPVRYTRLERDGEYYVAVLGAVVFGLALGALIVGLVIA